MAEDLYQILGVSNSASKDEIKKAYRNLAKQYHPDKTGGDKEAELKLKKINEAYDILKNDQKRAAYDRHGNSPFGGGGQGGFGGGFSGGFSGDDLDDIFSSFFQGGRQRSSARSQHSMKAQGADLRYNLDITLEEAFSGTTKEISFKTYLSCNTCSGSGSKDGVTEVCSVCAGSGVKRVQQGFFAVEQTCPKCMGVGYVIKNPCHKCSGQGRVEQTKHLKVNIPAGVHSGSRIRLTGEAEAGLRGGAAGTLHIFLTVKEHPIFKVDDSANLHCKMPVSFVKAALGGEVEVPQVDGGRVKLKIPAGVQSGAQLRLKSKGMSNVRSTARGDMMVHVHVQTPKNLNKKQKEILENFAKETSEETSDDPSFLDKMKNLWC